MSSFDVFLSYSSLDAEIAEVLCKTLEEKGMSCWIAPRNITPGMHWGEAIIEGINASKIMVVVFSDNSNKSQQVLREVERAVSKGLYVLPFRVQPTLPSKAMEYFLSTTHWFNALTTPLEVHAERLVELVRTIIVQTSPVQTEMVQVDAVQANAGEVPEITAPKSENTPEKISKKEATQAAQLREQVALVLSHAKQTCALGREAVRGIGGNSSILEQHLQEIETGLASPDLPITIVLSQPDLSTPTLQYFGIQTEGAAVNTESDISEKIPVSSSGKKVLGVTIQFVPNVSRLVEGPALASRVVTEAALLIFVADAREGFPEATIPFLREIARHGNVGFLVHGSGGEERNWWDEIGSASEGLILPTEYTDSPPEFSFLQRLFGVEEIVCLLVHLFEASRRLWDAAILASDERQQMAQSLKINQATKRKEIAFIDSQGLRSASPEIVVRVEHVDQQLMDLIGGIEKLHQRALAPGGRLHALSRVLVQSVTAVDLRQEVKTLGVMLKEDKLKIMTEAIRAAVNDQMRAATKILDDGVKIALDEEFGGDGVAMRVRELIRNVPRPSLAEIMPDTTVLKSHYRGELKQDEGVKPARFQIFKKLLKAAVDLSPFVEPARGALSWEIQLFAKEVLERTHSSYKTTVEGMRRSVRAGLGTLPDDGIQQRRKDLEEKLGGIDANLLAVEGRARELQDLQQACAEVDSEVRNVVREIIKPVLIGEEVKEVANG